MLPTWLDAKNMVCKWLVLPVGDYLALGSPPQDYTDLTTVFRKSDQADIDVGEMFHNFLISVGERHALGIRHVRTAQEGEPEETVLRRFTRRSALWGERITIFCLPGAGHPPGHLQGRQVG